MPSPTEITVAQLSRLVGTPDAPIIVDVCIDEDFVLNPRLIPSAFRFAHTNIEQLVPRLSGARVVIYCQKGKKLSMGAAALLRTHGVSAEYLLGGKEAWQRAKLEMVPEASIPHSSKRTGSLWVSRHRPKIDRIACPWLIRRFVDRSAQFLFVSPTAVLDVAERFDATPFDVEDVFWSHRDDKCTFDTMLDEFQLSSAPLQKIAAIVRGADTDQLDLVPECAGLLAMSLGLSRMHRDDLEQLDAGMQIYDMLYRWARDASDEKHDWPDKSATRQKS